MGRRTVFSIVLLFVALGLLTEIGLTAPLAAWTAVDTGIDYQEFTTSDPNNLFVARMDRSITSVTIESALGQGRINGGTEVVTGMAQRYDQAINYWDQSWGSRNRVAVAINGSFFDPNTGIIDGGQVHSGWYDKRFINFGPSGFSWNLNRSTFIGECVSHPSAKQFISYPATGNTQTFQGIGVPRGSDELILYTPQFDADTGTDNSGAEVLVELTRPALIMPSPSYVSGYVREVRDGQGSTPIPFGHVVLSATGTARSTLLANVSVGDEIRISQELRSLSEDCSTKLTYDWTKTYASIEGSYIFLKDGVVQSFNDTGATTRNPRTAICFNDSHVFFMVVDGRDPGTSVGMTMEELGSFASNTLGATWCINQDGGGSSTMVVSGQVVNNPSDGSQRAVANGMLMVVVEPVERSLTFSVGEAVETTASTTVRLGPGTNYAAAATVAGGSLGTVRADFNGLDGVLAKGSHWWKVDFGDMAGWVDEAFLISSGPTPTPTDTPTSTPTPSATFTATNTPTASVTPTATITPSPSNTPTATPVPSDTPTATNTPTPTDTPASTTMHVGDLDGASEKLARGFWSAQVTISVHDDAHASVASVAVSATFYQNGTLVGSVACTTDSTGACTVDSGPFPDKMGKASFVVEDLSHGTLSYDAVSNHDPDGDSDGTSISLGK